MNPILIVLGLGATVASSAWAYRYISNWMTSSEQTGVVQAEQASTEQNAAAIRSQLLTETYQPWLLLSIPVSILLGAVWLARRQSKKEEEYDNEADSQAGDDGEYEEEESY